MTLKKLFKLTRVFLLSFIIYCVSMISCRFDNSCSTLTKTSKNNNFDSFEPNKKSGTFKILISDLQIQENIKDFYGLSIVEMGSDGSCLLHSLRTQISQYELEVLTNKYPSHLMPEKPFHYNPYSKSKESTTNSKNVDILRKIAIGIEKDFLQKSKDLRYKDLSHEDQIWADEMSKDFYEEIFKKSAENTHSWFIENSEEKRWQFIKKQQETYFEATSRKNNFTGTSEAIALARGLDRGLKLFGHDRASNFIIQEKDLENAISPYFSLKGPKELLVYQLGGGGHYQMLVSQPLSL